MAFFTRWYWIIGSLQSVLWAQERDVEIALRRVYDHLLVGDSFHAMQEGKVLIDIDPGSVKARSAYLTSLCLEGEEMEALEQFALIWNDSDVEVDKYRVMETLAWGVLHKGGKSPLLLSRFYALIGAAMTHDAKALPLLLEAMRGSNALLRSLAIKLSISYGDAPLRHELLRLLEQERVWFVRLEAIKAVGVLHMKEAQETLCHILEHPKNQLEEKVAAIRSLVSIYESIKPHELDILLTSKRADLRLLGSALIASLQLYEEKERLSALLHDTSMDVRFSALHTLGMLQIKELNGRTTVEEIEPLLQSTHPALSITASWLALYLGYQEGLDRLRTWMEEGSDVIRRLASSALSVLGPRAIPLIKERIVLEKDLFVRVHLALGLLGQRVETDLACEVLYEALQQETKELWMWKRAQYSGFRMLATSTVRLVDQIPRYPQMVDQMTRLELLSMLCMLQYPKALEAVRSFLQKQEWGITGMAGAILLQEGDASALEVVEALLQDEDTHVRLQAGFLLGTLHRSSKALDVLMNSYDKASKEERTEILEALGMIGDRKSLSFLLQVLQEPFQGLRTVSACAILQCLHH